MHLYLDLSYEIFLVGTIFYPNAAVFLSVESCIYENAIGSSYYDSGKSYAFVQAKNFLKCHFYFYIRNFSREASLNLCPFVNSAGLKILGYQNRADRRRKNRDIEVI